jgi:transcriptional regulator with XRE-family HTH domain
MTPARARLGKALREIRAEMGLTLAEVAARTGLAISTLSKVENGLMSLTYDKLLQLSEGLEVDFAALLGGSAERPTASIRPPVLARRMVERRGSGVSVKTAHYDYLYLATELSNRAMVPILITIRARSMTEIASFSAHSGEEFIYVLRGPIELHTEFYAPTRLNVGDAIYIDSTMKHASLAAGRHPGLIMNVCHSPHEGHFRTLYEMASAQAVPAEGPDAE